MWDFVRRQPAVWAAAFALVAFAAVIGLPLPETLRRVLQAWYFLTEALMDFLFGWIWALLGLDMPRWAMAYLTVGVLWAGGVYRYVIHRDPARFRVREYEGPDGAKGDVELVRVLPFFRWQALLAALITVVAWPGIPLYVLLEAVLFQIHYEDVRFDPAHAQAVKLDEGATPRARRVLAREEPALRRAVARIQMSALVQLLEPAFAVAILILAAYLAGLAWG